MKKSLILFFLCLNLFASERVVTLSPSVNEIVFALGKGKNIVANTMFCNYPEESKSIPKVGGYSTISLEKILASKPSVVIAQNYDKKLISNLEALKIKTFVFKTDTLSQIKGTIKTLGTYFKKEDVAKDLTSKIDNRLDSLKNIVKNKKILIVISPRKTLTNQIYVAGNSLYFEDIIKASQNKNAYFSKSKAQPVVNTEKIINMNPDIIILLAPYLNGNEEARKAIKNAWKSLPINASKNDDIYFVDKEYAGIPSHRVIYFIDDFKKILQNVRDK